MNNNQEVTINGIGFVGLLQIVFIILKLCKIINWGWFFVLLPAIAYVVLGIFMFLIAFVVAYVSNE